MKRLLRFLGFLFTVGTILFLVGVAAAAVLFWHFSKGLPEYSQGLVRTGPDAVAVYGSDGFNPWLETVN